MTKRLSHRFIILLSCLILVYAAQGRGDRAPEAQQPTNPDAKVMADFKERVEKYVALRNDLKDKAPPLKQTEDPAKIQAAQAGLADEIQAARKDAKPGDIFTPETRELFRRLMYPELKGKVGADAKEALKEDAPKGVPLRVNAKYPDSAPLPTVPPNLLAALPKLPEDMEYRIINKDLILLDVRANLIVDYMRNVIR